MPRFDVASAYADLLEMLLAHRDILVNVEIAVRFAILIQPDQRPRDLEVHLHRLVMFVGDESVPFSGRLIDKVSGGRDPIVLEISPLPGDRIVGIVTTGKGVTVHTIDCETLEQFADTPERWIDVSWGEGQDNPENRIGRMMVTISNTPGALGTLSTVIGKSGGNITNLKITSRSVDFWDMYLDVSVTDTKHLNNIVAALRATPQVVSVERARGR